MRASWSLLIALDFSPPLDELDASSVDVLFIHTCMLNIPRVSGSVVLPRSQVLYLMGCEFEEIHRLEGEE
jgi:hypothetical protein